MRRRLTLIAAGALLALVAAPASAIAANPPVPAFGGPLTGGQAVPPVVTAATGEATVVISADASTITYIVTYSGLSGTPVAAHIHTGAAGINGGVILPLVAGPSPMVGTLTAANFSPSGAITTFAGAITALKTGGAYVNVHTAASPSGEIRGQVVAKGDAYFTSLAGYQEVPPVTTSASGGGWVVVSTGGSVVTYYVTHAGLSGAPVAAHIHLGNVGANGGVMLPLTAGTSPMTGALTAANLTPTGSVSDMAGAVAAIAAGGSYVNIHTAANPGGELRGQIAETVAAPTPAPSAAPTPALTAVPTVPPTSTSPVTTDPPSNGGLSALFAILAIIVTVTLLTRRTRATLPDRS